MKITEAAQALQPWLVTVRREFHQAPEVSGQERDTAGRIARLLAGIDGVTVREGVSGCGLLAEIAGGKPGPTVALRADMDALQITEETGYPYCSQRPGLMHACGHDMHVTMLLGAARLLAEHREELAGRVRLIFQPAEELTPVGGSRGMIAAGALADAAAVFGLHVWPQLPAGKVGVRAGPLMAASDHIMVRITGRSSHAATPHEGVDALVAAAQYILAVQTIVSRNADPLKSIVITLGRCTAGTRHNIVAGSCEIEGTCRTFDPDVRDLAQRRLEEVLQGVCAMTGCTGVLNYERGYMAVMNDAAMTDYAEQTACALLGDGQVCRMAEPSMCAEDFAFYLKETPGAFLWLGCGKNADAPPLHNSKFDPDESILWRGSALLAGLALDFDGSAPHAGQPAR